MGMRRTKQLVLKVLLKALSAKKYVDNFIKKNIFRQFEMHLFDEFSKKASKYNLEAVNFEQDGICKGSFHGKEYLINFMPGDHIESQIYLHGVHEEQILNLMNIYLEANNGGVMIDIGANIGASTIPLAVKHNSIKFYCYEPHPVVFNRLESNVKLNQLKNINTINCAISDSDKEHLVFYAQKKSGNMGKSSLKHNQDIGQCDEIKVPIKNIDITFSDSNENIVLIKIDTQGTEPEIIRACKKTISEHRPVIFFEFEDRYYTDDERSKEKIFLSNFFNELNYSLFNISEDINYYPSIDITKKYHGDILAIPR